jgi:hypothetical protein
MNSRSVRYSVQSQPPKLNRGSIVDSIISKNKRNSFDDRQKQNKTETEQSSPENIDTITFEKQAPIEKSNLKNLDDIVSLNLIENEMTTDCFDDQDKQCYDQFIKKPKMAQEEDDNEDDANYNDNAGIIIADVESIAEDDTDQMKTLNHNTNTINNEEQKKQSLTILKDRQDNENDQEKVKVLRPQHLKFRIDKQKTSFFKKLIEGNLSVTNIYLLNLAITDLLYLAIIPPYLSIIITDKWNYNLTICKLTMFIPHICQCSSVFIIVILSIDRYISVQFPLSVNRYRTQRVARIVISISWLLSFTFALPTLILTKLVQSGCHVDFPSDWSFLSNKTKQKEDVKSSFLNLTINDSSSSSHLDQMLVASLDSSSSNQNASIDISPYMVYSIYMTLLNYVLPMIIIIFLYSQILFKVQNSRANLTPSKQKISETRKISHMVYAIVFCYTLFWLPYWANQIFLFLCYSGIVENRCTNIILAVAHWTQVSAYLSSVCNPYIYCFLSETFRNQCQVAFDNCCCCSNSTFDKYSSIDTVSNEDKDTRRGWTKSIKDMFSKYNIIYSIKITLDLN